MIEKSQYGLTWFRVRFGLLQLKAYTKGEDVLRLEATVHNTKELRCRRSLDNFPEIITRLAGMAERFATTLDAAELGLSNVKVARVWREYGLQPWRAESFKFSTDPKLEAKVRGVVGLYLNPPDKAVVLCVDEKPPGPGAGTDCAGAAATAGYPREAQP